MAVQHPPAVSPAPASIVGNAFVIRYYNVLHQSPQHGHRFYTDESKLSRAESWTKTAVESATTLAGIHEKIMSSDYSLTRAEIMSVDSQESSGGNVLIVVTGALFNADGVKRKFLQTFVLVPQDKSYFILNDVFRYLDGEEKPDQQPEHDVGKGVSKLEESPVSTLSEKGGSDPAVMAETHGSQRVLEEQEVASTVENTSEVENDNNYEGQKLITETVQHPVDDGHNREELSPDHVHDSISTTEQTQILGDNEDSISTGQQTQRLSDNDGVTEVTVDEAPKKSYASILRIQKCAPKTIPSSSSLTTTTISSAMVQTATPASVSESARSSQPVSVPSPEPNDEPTTVELEGDIGSVYVKNLPLNVKVAEIRQEFSKFGKIKPGGVNLRNQRIGVCYAFIEFEEVKSAESAVQASPVNMNGRQVYVEEKRSLPLKGGRARIGQGRGLQIDVIRGGRNNFTGRGGAGQNGNSQNGGGFKTMRGTGGQVVGNSQVVHTGVAIAAA